MIGIVGIVALLALLITIRVLAPPSAGGDEGNLLGLAAGDIKGSGQTVTYDGREYPVFNIPEDTGDDIEVSVREGAATFTSPDGVFRPFTLRLGESAAVTLIEGSSQERVVVTLMRLRAASADVVAAPEAESCGAVDGATPLCRGPSACCGDACVQLPSCEGKADGQVSACGQRAMYCCGGRLGTRACGEAASRCEIDDKGFGCRDAQATVVETTAQQSQQVSFTLSGQGAMAIMDATLTCMDGQAVPLALTRTGGVRQDIATAATASCQDIAGKQTYDARFSFRAQLIARDIGYDGQCFMQQCLPPQPESCPVINQVAPCLPGETPRPIYGEDGCQSGIVCAQAIGPSGIECPATACASRIVRGSLTAPVMTAVEATSSEEAQR